MQKKRNPHAEAAKRIGDGSQLKPEHFASLTYAERTALFKANPERYSALRDGREPGDAWTPDHGRSGQPMGVQGADL